jgi:hypothetical protein
LLKLREYFREYPGVFAIVLTGSLARGRAVKGSCVDLVVFLGSRHFNLLSSTLDSRIKAYSRLGGNVCYYEGNVEGGIEFGDFRVDVSFTDGNFACNSENSFDITRDYLETTVGNLMVYSVTLYEKGKQLQRLKEKYLPFYDDALREIRLKGTASEFKYKVWKTAWLTERGEHFAALDTLLEAQRIFLQHLFIKRRKHPIDYVKWLKEQCSQILAMPELYQELAKTIDGLELSTKGIMEKTELLKGLFARYGSSDAVPRSS